jgi:hypothetical protein
VSGVGFQIFSCYFPIALRDANPRKNTSWVSGPEGRKNLNLAQGASRGKQTSNESIAPEGRKSVCRRTFFRPFRGSLARQPPPRARALG